MRHAWITLGVAAAFAPPAPKQQRSHPLRANDEPFDVSKLQGKAARLDTRRRQIYAEHQQRKASGETYEGDGLLLDNRLDAGIDFCAQAQLSAP